MVSVPLRAVPALAAAPTATVPLPVPDAPLVMVSHGALETAVQAHDGAEAVTVVDPVPPVSDTDCAVGAIVNVHGGGGGGAAAVWVTVNVFPAATIVADRIDVDVLGATANATVPLPVPDSPDVRLIHATLVDAVHAQEPPEAVTAIDPDAPASPTFCEAGEIENVQAGGGGAACEIVNVLPATVSVAVRVAPLLADTRYVTEPLPVPDVPELIVNQLADSVAVHAQPDPAVTRIMPVDESAPTLSPVGEIVKAQGVGVGVGVDGGVGAGAGAGVGAGGGEGPGVGAGAGAGCGSSAWAVC